MSNIKRDRGAVTAAILVALASVVVGGGAAAVAVSAVVASNAPNDSTAVKTGPSAPVDPGTVINYGG